MKQSYLIFLMLLSFGFILSSCSSDEPLLMEEEMEEAMEEVIEEEDVMEEEEETVDETEDDSDLEDAPSFSLTTFDGMELNSSTYDGKTLLIFFFGNSCPPCIGVAPDIEDKITQTYIDNEDFAIIGIDEWDGNAASVELFQDRTGVTFPLGLQGSPVANDYGTTYDRLVLVNENGKIVYKGTSIAANNLDEVIELLDSMLN